MSNLKISFEHPYKSITAFPDRELPRFAVLTGLNGSGKTHFLRALNEGALTVEAVDREQIRYFDWTSMFAVRDDEVTRTDVRRHGAEVLTALQRGRESHRWQLEQALRDLDVDFGSDPWVALRQRPSLEDEAEVKSVLEALRISLIRSLGFEALNALVRFGQDYGGGDAPNPLLVDAHTLQFAHLHKKLGGDAFGLRSLSSVVMTYFELELFNRLCQLDAESGRKPEVEPLDEASFRRRHGPPPCEIINEILARLGLEFTIEGPRHYTTDTYKAVLRDAHGAEVPLPELSSGEKMIMALALCTYASQSRTGPKISATRLALFDEIDAPLHPSMTKVMLEVINEIIVDKLGCAVILATHSPTTVALAPEDSVYAMRKGKPGVHLQTKQAAISLLTADLPTLSLDFEGRRQVFVESDNDARRYEALYAICRAELGHARSLSFISVGGKGKKGDEGMGCKAVLRMCKKLAECGNHSVFGLIDWDGENEPNDRVFVLAQGRRYAIESCLLDPLLLLGLITQHLCDGGQKQLGLAPDESVPKLLREQPERLQQLIEQLQELVLGPPEHEVEAVELRYRGGASLSARPDYLVHPGHSLESRVLAEFRLGKGVDLLDKSVRLLRSHPDWMPVEFVELFEALLSAEL